MKAQLVIEYVVELKGINLNSLTDKDFSNISWLNEREPIYNMKGEKVSKSYFYENKKEAVRIEYSKIIGNYEYNEVTYPETFLGWKKCMCWLDWAGEIGFRKEMQPYYFNLEPVFLADGTETVIGFSSPKMRKSMKEERYAADDYLQAKNPNLYDLLYNRYTSDYNRYLRTGNKTSLVAAMNSEADAGINAVFNNEVFGYAPMTVKELILMNLQ